MKPRRIVCAAAVCTAFAAIAFPQTPALLARRYVDGDRVSYLMTGTENDRRYQVRATATTMKNAAGQFVDEFAWSNLIIDGEPRAMSPGAEKLRLAVTTEAMMPFVPPDFSNAQPLVGPVTDTMTFYADLFLSRRMAAALQHAGDHVMFRNQTIGSWADGRVVVIGEDHVDFELTLKEIDRAAGVAVLAINHVPPAEPEIHLRADWMRAPVSDTANNWVMVRRTAASYEASVGKETFGVELRVALADGKLLTASLENPVTAIARDCADAALTDCGPARPSPVLRRVTMSRVDD